MHLQNLNLECPCDDACSMNMCFFRYGYTYDLIQAPCSSVLSEEKGTRLAESSFLPFHHQPLTCKRTAQYNRLKLNFVDCLTFLEHCMSVKPQLLICELLET